VAELFRLSCRMGTLVNFLYNCFENGVVVVSIREGWLEEAMKNEIVRSVVATVFVALYELEWKMISERTKAGMARAKAAGKHVGRKPKLSEEDLKRIRKLLSLGVPKKRIAELLGVSRTTLYRHFRK